VANPDVSFISTSAPTPTATESSSLIGAGSSSSTRLKSSALAVGVALLSGSAAIAAPGQVVLGKKNLFPSSQGWGTARPATIFNGGVPSGKAWHLVWTEWGSSVATAHGLTWIYRPGGGYFSKPAAIELRASRIGRCMEHGPRAYTHLEARVASRPGGPLGRWFVWGGWRSTCAP
jgi:hypothetical protein